MARSATLVVLLCLAAASWTTSSAARIAESNDISAEVTVDAELAEVEPQVELAENLVAFPPKALLGWGASSTPRYRTTTPRYTTRRPTTRRPSTTTSRSHDQSITWGGVYPYDKQLASKTVYKAATYLRVNTETVSISSPYATIHCIQVVDQLRTGKNAAVTLLSGGVGQRSASLRFDSKRGEKISYLLIVWGQ
ncbi:hypothetical protein FOCC_FOCC006985 [Frankliniella occidentalis]|uniref:Uncharacterized protein LOC113213094 n=1 Tax=Frankliniella occidentalis TaxID=133901 RepID=A0A6J1T3G8_FRAOC|nr:uncharacterized protein LOC113213094 [Frankliniella occidentalis]KAE8746313.1 hypothetical protein FOCC_FOCC006985 [Frankliniella occidentalis]